MGFGESGSAPSRLIGLLLAGVVCLAAFGASAAIKVDIAAPGGTAQQSLPDTGGSFDLSLPLNKNAVNNITVTASDDNGNTASQALSITQVSLDSIVVSQFTSEPLTPEEIETLVNEGVIDVENPENYNISQFSIVLTIADKQIPISFPMIIDLEEEEGGYENIRLPHGEDSGGAPPPAEIEVMLMEELLQLEEEDPDIPPIPAVFIIEGRIKSLKEFFSCRLLLLNASGIFTLSDVVANLEFPDGGLTNVLPADGIVKFGDILPGDGGQPGQVEKEFIIRGDEIGVRRVKVNFGGKVTGPGIPEDGAIPFNGGGETTVEVKGPPTFTVKVTHPDHVEAEEPYELKVDITNTGQVPALYASLDLDLGVDAELVTCTPNKDASDYTCEPIEGPVTRSLGHIYPGGTVSQTFTVMPHASGDVTSCMGISSQNIALQVYVGSLGCMAGHFTPDRGVSDGRPTVDVLPVPNATGVSIDSPVVAFFSEKMTESSIKTGEDGTFDVFTKGGDRVPGQIRFDTLMDRTVAVWQPTEAVGNRLSPDTEYSVYLKQGITDLGGQTLSAELISTFTTTGTDVDDTTPPELTLSVEPPVQPNNILPGEIVRIEAYASDQGSGVVRVEARIKDLDDPESKYQLVDQKTVVMGDLPPYIFSIDSANLVLGHSYQLMSTAYDYVGNGQNATLALTVASSADPPTITLPADPALPVLHGISVDVTPAAYTGAVRQVQFYLDAAAEPFGTSTLPPYQVRLSTLGLALGAHTVRAVAVDGLSQTGEDTLAFQLAENLNMPTVSFGAAVSGAQYVIGSTFVVNGQADDPVGIESVAFYLDEAKADPISTGTEPFVVDTTSLSLGAHVITIVATNKLGISNDPNAAGSRFEFSVVEPPPGAPPAPPTVTSVSYPEAGKVTIRGTSVAGARVDVSNASLSTSVSVYADAAGAFMAVIAAQAGHTLSLIAYDFSQSPDPSAATTVTVQAAPVLESIQLNPTSITFTSFESYQDITVTGHYEGDATQNVTAKATFSSSAPSVAAVSTTGRVAPIANGSAAITVSVGNKTANLPVTVNVVVLTHITVNPPTVPLVAINQTQQLTVTAHYSNGTSQVVSSGLTFNTSNASVATVSSSGQVRAKGQGSAGITVFLTGASPVVVPVSVNTGGDPAPTAQIASPADGTAVERGDTVSVTVQATDAVGGVTKVHLSASGAMTFSDVQDVLPSSLSTSRTFVFQVSNAAPIGGQIVLTAYSEDTGGNVSPSDQITLVVGDATPPSVEITTPATGARYNSGDDVVIAITATDASGVILIRYETTGGVVKSGSKTVSPAGQTANATFTFKVPYGVSNPDVRIRAFAQDAGGHEGAAAPVDIIITSADITPPATEATAVSNPGSSSTTTVTYHVTDGLDDLDHVELFFRRDGIGTFNRYTRPDAGNALGEFTPQSGSTGTIVFDSTRMGGDGYYEFYTIGVDEAGNREAAPTDGKDSGEKAVVADQDVTIAAGTVWTVIDGATTIALGDSTFDNLNVRIDAATVTLGGHHVFHNVELINGAVLTHPDTDLTNEYSVDLDVWTLTIDSTSSVNVNDKGYLGGGHGANSGSTGRTVGNIEGSTYRSGGSYGGVGGAYDGTPCATYGDLTMPVDLGSGGSSGGCGVGGDGGGRVQVQAINIVADGPITAEGESVSGCQAGSGSGGSIYFITATLSGTGAISVNGGVGEVGGGGGRTAVHYIDMSTKDTGTFEALGGNGSNRTAGNGTVFLKGVDEGNGTLVLDGQGASVTTFSPLPIPSGLVFDNIILRNNARILVDTPLVVNDTLSILTGSMLTHSLSSEAGIEIEANLIHVDDTSSIDASSRGYRGGGRDGNSDSHGLTDGGLPGAAYRSGGTHGGYGGVYDGSGTNEAYGDPSAPSQLGSGGSSGGCGAGGNGGGYIKIAANELDVDGQVLANGGSVDGCQSGGGSGGSIWIQASMIKGDGLIAANGGGNEVGGGGGRVALHCDIFNMAETQVQAMGGAGSYRSGGHGTVLLQLPGETLGTLIMDGQGQAAPEASTPLREGYEFDNVVLRNGAQGVVESALTVNDTLSIESNSTLSVNVPADAEFAIEAGAVEVLATGRMTHALSSPAGLKVLAGDFTIEDGGTIDVTEKGYRGGGRYGNSNSYGLTVDEQAGAAYRSGGSYGGIGGVYDGAGSNPTYGHPAQPAYLGSGGSSGGCGNGGNGGGLVKIVAASVTVDGTLVADGGTISGCQAGGGSGGSVWIDADVVSGTGAISANGGGSEVGGGGGRIAVYCTTLALAESHIEALGGQGNNRIGGNGTIYIKYAGSTQGDLIIDGAEASTPEGTTPIPEGIELRNLTVRNRARAYLDQPLSISGTLTVETNSLLTLDVPEATEYGITANQVSVGATGSITHAVSSVAGVGIQASGVTVNLGGSIDVSARGYRGGGRDGNVDSHGLTVGGALGAAYRSGGSYGGYGGVYEGAGTNEPYGDPAAPDLLGSGGSSGGCGSGGNGGGRIKIAAQTVTVNGALRADGQTVNGCQSGGGSGGSIWIDTNMLTGTGTISANGGGSEVGGGGGRVAVYCASSTFDEALFQVLGGQGSNRTGGNGTLYIKLDSQTHGNLIVDGLGHTTPDMSTPILTTFDYDNVVVRNRARVFSEEPLIVTGLVAVETEAILSIAVPTGTTWGITAGQVETRTGGVLTHALSYKAGLAIQADEVLVEDNSAIDVTGKGYRGGGRDGNADSHGLTVDDALGAAYRSGGSHGGLGNVYDGAGTNALYGDEEEPIELGSGGSSGGCGIGGNGGGRIRIDAPIVEVNGGILANGQTVNGCQAGGGSGGSVWVSTTQLTGTGTIAADGGGSEVGGGGGRVAVYYDDAQSDLIALLVEAAGGSAGGHSGQDGSVHLEPTK